MLTDLVVGKIVHAGELFAQCVRAELDRAQTPQLVREQLAIIFDNAMTRYEKSRGDAVTRQAITQLRPKIGRWLTSTEK